MEELFPPTYYLSFALTEFQIIVKNLLHFQRLLLVLRYYLKP